MAIQINIPTGCIKLSVDRLGSRVEAFVIFASFHLHSEHVNYSF